jgi:hypothetical protein
MKNQIFFLLAFSGILFASCEKSNHKPNHREDHCGCDPQIICTMEVVSLNLSVTDQNGQPVILDKIVTGRSNGQIFEFPQREWNQNSNQYTFWSDGQRKVTQKMGESILVKGFRDGNQIFSQTFKVGHDCCHVLLKEGNREIVVNTTP